MTIIFAIAGFFEVATYGQVTAFTPLYLPRLGIEVVAVAFWVGAITSFSNVAGLPFLPFWEPSQTGMDGSRSSSARSSWRSSRCR